MGLCECNRCGRNTSPAAYMVVGGCLQELVGFIPFCSVVYAVADLCLCLRLVGGQRLLTLLRALCSWPPRLNITRLAMFSFLLLLP